MRSCDMMQVCIFLGCDCIASKLTSQQQTLTPFKFNNRPFNVSSTLLPFPTVVPLPSRKSLICTPFDNLTNGDSPLGGFSCWPTSANCASIALAIGAANCPASPKTEILWRTDLRLMAVWCLCLGPRLSPLAEQESNAKKVGVKRFISFGRR